MTDDIVARLRNQADWLNVPSEQCGKVADEIERLRTALQEIAWIATPDHEEARHKATEIARAALEGEKTDD